MSEASFEYKQVNLYMQDGVAADNPEKELNDLADKGWSVIVMAPTPGSARQMTYLLVRQK